MAISTQEPGVYFQDVYQKLAATFDHTYQRVVGGTSLDYLTGEQVISRLNEVLGVAGWSFTIKDHGVNAEADECWALGLLEINCGGTMVSREQFGSNKIKRRSAGRFKDNELRDQLDKPLDLGFDLKGAATDALKKCASLVGVGLYLSKKEEQTPASNGQEPSTQVGSTTTVGGQHAEASLACAQCGKELAETRFRDGTTWPPSQLADYGRRKHNKVLCMDCYRKANAAKRGAGEEVSF